MPALGVFLYQHQGFECFYRRRLFFNERFGLSREIGAAVIPEKWAGFRPAAFGFGAELPPDIAFAGPDQRNSAAVAGSALAQPDEDFRQDAEFIRSVGSARLQP